MGKERDKTKLKEGALQKIQSLLDSAAVVFPESSARANKLVAQAHKLMQRNRIKIPSVLKRRFCKKCRSLWVPEKSVRVRLSKGRVIYSCLACRYIWRFPLD